VYFLLQQIKSKPSVFSLNHSGDIGLTLLPNKTNVSAAAIHGLTERMNNIISKCSLLSLDRRGEKTPPPPPAKTVSQLLHLLAIQFNVQFPDEWITVQCRKNGLVTQILGQFFVNVTPSSRGSLLIIMKNTVIWLRNMELTLRKSESGCQHSKEVLLMSCRSWSWVVTNFCAVG